MTTKTVINTNMPSTRGISILIDDQDPIKPPQQQHEKPEQQHSKHINNAQQQSLRSTQKAETGKITIYQNTTTKTTTQMAPTPATAITRTVLTQLQPQPGKLVAKTTTKTAGAPKNGVNDINKYAFNNDIDNNDDNYYYANNEHRYNKQRHLFNTQSGEFENVEQTTGYSTIKQTTSTAVPTFPHLLLKVMSERGKTEYEKSAAAAAAQNNNNEEIHEAWDGEKRNVMDGGKLQAVGIAGVAGGLDGQSNNNNNSEGMKINVSTHTNALSTTTNEVAQAQNTAIGQIHQHRMMIIQCNGNNEAANDELSNNYERTINQKQHYHTGSPLVVRETIKSTATLTASNVDHEDNDDESNKRRVSGVVAGNGQDAFERICTNDDQNGNKYQDRRRCHETTSKTIDCSADDQQQLESEDVNANTNVNAIVVNNNNNNDLPIAKINAAETKAIINTYPTIKTESNCASAVTVTGEELSAHSFGANIIKTENQNLNENNFATNQTPLHVLKIQIKPQEVYTINEKKQVTVVTLNELQVEKLEQQQINDLKFTLPVHKFEPKKSARPALTTTTTTLTTSESANNLQHKANNVKKMVQKPTTINTAKTALSLTTTPSSAAMTSTTILNSGAVSVTTGGGSTNLNSKTNANGNGQGNGNAGGGAPSNGNTNGSVHGNGSTNGSAHSNGTTYDHAKSNGTTNGNANTLAIGNTSVTELNAPSAHPSSSYLYYVMSSGQFSPCDTLDSGTGSDLESNGNIMPAAPTAQSKLQTTLDKLNAAAAVHASTATTAQNGLTPKMELLLKSTKIRLNANNGSTKKPQHDTTHNSAIKYHNTTTNSDHSHVRSFTDSEESEASSLSCDSLHSTEFMRQSSVSPPTTPPKSMNGSGVTTSRIKMLGSFLPDSLLRDIRDRKFSTNDFELKYGNGGVDIGSGSTGSPDDGSDADPDAHADDDDDATSTTITNTLPDALNEQEYMNVEHTKFLCEHNTNNINTNNNNNKHNTSKRLSLPNKTFVFNAENGTFVDTKMDSMPRKYEADKYYTFHVKEHENFHSFDMSGGGASFTASDLESLSEYETKGLQDDAFAGYKDIRCGSATSTIRSSKGTVRGVKNRVRNGIATFLQLQQPNMKNFKEKDAGKVVLYTTSMGIIRDTYAKCANVKQILRTLLVKFEERDVFMSIEYQQEIKERMHSEAIKVPQLFVEGQHIGDADTVERLNESGELRQLLKPYKSIATTFTCQTCGGYRLLPCPSCNGSKKSVHRNHFTAEFVALKCMNCDEVGLVKCHNC